MFDAPIVGGGSVARLDGFAERFVQAIAHCKINQTEFARRLDVSPGFVSDVVRGNKKPGAEFLFGVRKTFGISIDWLLTGEGTLIGTSGIDLALLRTIRLQIAVAKRAVLDCDLAARELLSLIRDGRTEEAKGRADVARLLKEIAPDDEDYDLASELYNGHVSTQDENAKHRNLLGAAVAHFEARKPMNMLASLSKARAVS